MRIAMILVAAVFLAGCGAHQEHQPAAAPAGALSDTDRAFIELVIPQDESALELVSLAKSRETSAPLAELAGTIDARYRTELAQLRAFLAEAGVPETAQHEGHDMPGMITRAELDAIALAQGTAFDVQATQALKTHLQEVLPLVRGEQTAGTAEPVRKLAADIEQNRTTQLARLG
jgi:uncharacterized protein (DUF305 family)